MIGQPPTRTPILTANQGRRLQRLWQRTRTQAADRATQITRREMGQVIDSRGQLREIAARLVGDVTGLLSAAVVVALRGIPIHTTAPLDGEALIYNAAQDRLEYGPAGGGGRWEPLSNMDPSDPQLLFDGNGDVLMTLVED